MAELGFPSYTALTGAMQIDVAMALASAPNLALNKFPWSGQPAINLDGTSNVTADYLDAVMSDMEEWHGRLLENRDMFAGVDVTTYLTMITRIAFRVRSVKKLLLTATCGGLVSADKYCELMRDIRVIEKTNGDDLMPDGFYQQLAVVMAFKYPGAMAHGTFADESDQELTVTAMDNAAASLMTLSDLILETSGAYRISVAAAPDGILVLSETGDMTVGDVVTSVADANMERLLIPLAIYDYVKQGGILASGTPGWYILRTATRRGTVLDLDSDAYYHREVREGDLQLCTIGGLGTSVETLIEMYEYISSLAHPVMVTPEIDDDGAVEPLDLSCIIEVERAEDAKEVPLQCVAHAAMPMSHWLRSVGLSFYGVSHVADEFIVLSPERLGSTKLEHLADDDNVFSKLAVVDEVYEFVVAGGLRSDHGTGMYRVRAIRTLDGVRLDNVADYLLMSGDDEVVCELGMYNFPFQTLLDVFMTVVEVNSPQMGMDISYIRVFPWFKRREAYRRLGVFATTEGCRKLVMEWSLEQWHERQARVNLIGSNSCHFVTIGCMPLDLPVLAIEGLIPAKDDNAVVSVRSVVGVYLPELRVDREIGIGLGGHGQRMCSRRACDCYSDGDDRSVVSFGSDDTRVDDPDGVDDLSRSLEVLFYGARSKARGLKLCVDCRVDRRYAGTTGSCFVNYDVDIRRSLASVAYAYDADGHPDYLVVTCYQRDRDRIAVEYPELDTSRIVTVQQAAKFEAALVVLVVCNGRFNLLCQRVALMRCFARCDALKRCDEHKFVVVVGD